MKSLRFGFFFLAGVLLLSACNPGYDVYLLIGQSNMAGRGVFAPADTLAPLEGVFLLDDRGEPVPAVEPLNRYSTIRKAMHVQGMSLAHGFAAQAHASTGRRVLLVMNARGGTSLGQWLPDAPLGRFSDSVNEEADRRGQQMPSFYGEAVRRTRQALRYGQLKAILWHQGESDSDSVRVASYLPKLARLVESLRTDLGVGEEVPFVAGQIQPRHENARFFNPVISRIGEAVPNAFCVSSEGLETLPDHLHFTREAQLELGRRYASVLFGSPEDSTK